MVLSTRYSHRQDLLREKQKQIKLSIMGRVFVFFYIFFQIRIMLIMRQLLFATSILILEEPHQLSNRLSFNCLNNLLLRSVPTSGHPQISYGSKKI